MEGGGTEACAAAIVLFVLLLLLVVELRLVPCIAWKERGRWRWRQRGGKARGIGRRRATGALPAGTAAGTAVVGAARAAGSLPSSPSSSTLRQDSQGG